MLTVLDSIKLTTEYLQNKGIESPRINAELLLAKILNCKRLNLYLMFDRPLKQEEIELYREFMRRRSGKEPLQYIIGSVEFYGLEFIVNKNVLIPRQETEILVEKVIEYASEAGKIRILDIGTGSGNIAISLAKNLEYAAVTSIDVSSAALETANENSERNRTSGRVSFRQIDILNDNQLECNDFDIIVSNPPYIASESFPELEPELRIFEPKIALTDNSDGLTFYRGISIKAKKLLKDGGRLYFEVGEGQSEKVVAIMEENYFNNIRIFKDYLNIDRVVTGELCAH